MQKITFIIISLALSTQNVMAADTTNILTEQMKDVMKHPPVIPSISNIVLSTLFMVLIVYIVAFIYKKISNFNQKSFSALNDKSLGLNKLNIINSKSLGANNAIHVVEVNNKYLILGSTPANISLLKEFDKKKLIDEDISNTSSAKQENSEMNIERGLKAIYPEENIKETSRPKNKDEQNTDFEEIYKKYTQ